MDLPFLYLTRTILRSRKPSPQLLHLVLRPQSKNRCIHQQTQQSVQDDSQTSFFRKKAQAVAARLGQSDSSSLTKEEKRSFDNLRHLAGQGQRVSHQLDDTPDGGLLNVEPERILALFTPTGSPQQDVDGICKDYIQSISDEFKSALTSETHPGDYAVWRVLRRRVFPLLLLLKHPQQISKEERLLAIKALPVTKAIFKPRQSEKVILKPAAAPLEEGDPEADEKETTSATASSEVSSPSPSPSNSFDPLPILTRIYPAALLIAIRLLTRHYPISTLSHSLLPHLRSLGASSYVLGTNTYFYNTFVFLRWNVYSSLREVCDLLTEMEHGAVEFDRGTYKVLSFIAQERWNDMTQDELRVDESFNDESIGSRGRQWWMKPEQMRMWAKVEEWMRSINRQLEDRGMGEVIREGPGTVPGFCNGQTERGVWL